MSNNQLHQIDISHLSDLNKLYMNNNFIPYSVVNHKKIDLDKSRMKFDVNNQKVEAKIYQVEGAWYLDLTDLVGEGNESYILPQGEDWLIDDSGVAVYQGTGQPTEFSYDAMLIHMDGLNPATKFGYQLEATATLSETKEQTNKVTFVSGDPDLGQVSGSLDVKADDLISSEELPEVTIAEGYKLSGWEDVKGNAIDLATFKPYEDITLYAIFEKASDEEIQQIEDEKAGAEAGTVDGSKGAEAADNSEQSAAYQEAYTKAYIDAVANYQKGFEAGNADAKAGVEAVDTSDQDEAYQNGYADGFKSVDNTGDDTTKDPEVNTGDDTTKDPEVNTGDDTTKDSDTNTDDTTDTGDDTKSPTKDDDSTKDNGTKDAKKEPKTGTSNTSKGKTLTKGSKNGSTFVGQKKGATSAKKTYPQTGENAKSGRMLQGVGLASIVLSMVVGAITWFKKKKVN